MQISIKFLFLIKQYIMWHLVFSTSFFHIGRVLFILRTGTFQILSAVIPKGSFLSTIVLVFDHICCIKIDGYINRKLFCITCRFTFYICIRTSFCTPKIFYLQEINSIRICWPNRVFFSRKY